MWIFDDEDGLYYDNAGRTCWRPDLLTAGTQRRLVILIEISAFLHVTNKRQINNYNGFSTSLSLSLSLSVLWENENMMFSVSKSFLIAIKTEQKSFGKRCLILTTTTTCWFSP